MAASPLRWLLPLISLHRSLSFRGTPTVPTYLGHAGSPAPLRASVDTVDDRTGCTVRTFSLGSDVTISSFVGSMGFDELIDWEYYDPDSGRGRISPTGRTDVVDPNPLDPGSPRRTRTGSGNLVRLFRGDFAGRIGASLRAAGKDARILLKEFSGDVGLDLAANELRSLAEMQGALFDRGGLGGGSEGEGGWFNDANDRLLLSRAGMMTVSDNLAVVKLCGLLATAPFVGALGVLDTEEYDTGEADPYEWRNSLGGSDPPAPGSVWIAYEYAGLATAASYSVSHTVRRGRMPPRRGPFGVAMNPPALPPWEKRANYVAKGVLRGCLEALATTHEGGLAHRSIGTSSVILSSVAMDKTEAVSPFAEQIFNLRVKLSDFGFAGPINASFRDPDFRARARAFSVAVEPGRTSFSSTGFAIAEDLHALGFVFLQVLLTSLAEPPTPDYVAPPCDVDTLQRLLGDIFDNDVYRFAEYCEEEASWSKVVGLLGRDEGAGWEVLRQMCYARERVSELQGSLQMVTARALLSSPFFAR